VGPTEQAAVRAVSALLWPVNPTSRRVARAVVVAARVLDADRSAWYPYAGPVADVHNELHRLLGELNPTPSELERIRAERLCRPVERAEVTKDAEMNRLISTTYRKDPP
jgi:erythromycin esterase-like protein